MKQIDSGIYINQAKYARNLVKRFRLKKVAHARTPMAANAKLTNDPLGESVDVTLYRSMIGCFLYLIASCLIIAFNLLSAGLPKMILYVEGQSTMSKSISLVTWVG